jgi:uroporphyrin-III C-methyltransferase/precorrin-2 dehydrogenase/sirohydrochlorin ferrochelatase/uroporphyrin-III C-methyltransferase
MSQNKTIHPVIFAGAGPGDPELITLKTIRHLREAEVVITDRLVSDMILETYVQSKALVLHAGKQRGRNGSTPQHIINELLIEYTLQGKKVVRLKGGDVSVFSNLLDELQALNKYGIPYEIVPGITAACGAAAYAGIPLTAREYANAVRILTLHKNEIFQSAYWKELANTEDTLVFYMSGDTTDELVNQLTTHGINQDRFIAVIEQATTPNQKVLTAPIYSYQQELGNRSHISPTLVIVGKVAALHDSLKWKPETETENKLYFKPIAKNNAQEVRA